MQGGQAFDVGDLAAGDAVHLDFDAHVVARVQAGVGQQVFKAGAADVAGIHRQALAVAHRDRHHVALVGVVHPVVVQIGEGFFDLERDTVAVHVGRGVVVLGGHHIDHQRRAAARGVACRVLEAVLDVPAANRQVGQRHQRVGGFVVQAGHLAAIHHQHHAGVLEVGALHLQTENAHRCGVGANDLGGLCGRRRRIGQQGVGLCQAFTRFRVAVVLANHLQLNAAAAAGQQLDVEPAQHVAVYQRGQVGPAGTGWCGTAAAVDAAVQALVGVKHRCELRRDGLQVFVGLEILAREAGIGGQAQAKQLGQLFGDAVDHGLHFAQGVARRGVVQRLGQQRQVGGLYARGVDAQQRQVGQRQGAAVVEQAVHRCGQGFHLGHGVDRRCCGVADDAVEQRNAFVRQGGCASGANGGVGVACGVDTRSGIGKRAIGFTQNLVVGADDGVHLFGRIGQGTGDGRAGQRRVDGAHIGTRHTVEPGVDVVHCCQRDGVVAIGKGGNALQTHLARSVAQVTAQFGRAVDRGRRNRVGHKTLGQRFHLGHGDAGDAHGAELFGAQGFAGQVALRQRHDLAHAVGQRFDFADGVHRIKAQVANHVVEQAQRRGIQRGCAGGADAGKVR